MFRNLGNNLFPELPSEGLEGVVHLKTFNNPNLREFPGPESFPRVRTLVLSYAYHCCQFSSLTVSTGHPNSALESSLQEDVIYPTDRDFDSALSTLNLSELWPGLGEYVQTNLSLFFFTFSHFLPPNLSIPLSSILEDKHVRIENNANLFIRRSQSQSQRQNYIRHRTNVVPYCVYFAAAIAVCI